MKSINFEFDTYISTQKSKKVSNYEDVSSDTGYVVTSYNDLIEKLAALSFFNHEYNLLYRGQKKDFLSSDGVSALFPTLFRGSVAQAKKKKLNLCRVDKYFNGIIEESNYLGGMKMLRFAELRWAILQHYEICDTPFLDVTRSLHVACTFALKDAQEYGFLYVLGFPHFSSTLCASIEEELQILRLFGAVPPKAKRPLHQDGFLVADFPSGIFEDINKKMYSKLNFNRRLMCKFKLIKKDFWRNGFSELQGSLLMPRENGKIHNIIKKIKDFVDKEEGR